MSADAVAQFDRRFVYSRGIATVPFTAMVTRVALPAAERRLLSTTMNWPFSSKAKLTKLQRGNHCMVAKDYVDAIKLFLAHVDDAPGDAATAFSKVAECYLRGNVLPRPQVVAPGVTLVSQGDVAGAKHYYRLALERDPGHFASLRGLAKILPEQSEERLRRLEQAVDVQPDTVMLTEIGEFYEGPEMTWIVPMNFT